MPSSDFEIPRNELVFHATRASGPGGQHVNKTASRVEVAWNVRDSRALSEAERERVLAKLGSRIAKDGTLRVVASATRSQHRNRELAEERINEVVRRALHVPRKRKPTTPTRAARAARLESKRRRSLKKAQRRAIPED